MNIAGKESQVNTIQTYHATTGVGRILAGGVMAPLIAALIAMSAISGVAGAAQQATAVTDALLDQSGNTMTLGQLALKFARSLTPPFVGSREADAITWLTGGQVGGQAGHQPPLSPIGGWGSGSRNATVGDLTVLLVQQFNITPTAASGGSPTAQDYQNALVGYTGSATVATYNSLASLFNSWTSPTINPLGPQPSAGEQPRS